MTLYLFTVSELNDLMLEWREREIWDAQDFLKNEKALETIRKELALRTVWAE
jgi:hypothetical protein